MKLPNRARLPHPPSASTTPDVRDLGPELPSLELIQALRAEIRDLRIALQTSNEHGDLMQEDLLHLSASLSAEVRERRVAEEKLRKLVDAATREKGDLEILVQILMEEGDQSAAEGERALIDGLTQIANRRRFDEAIALEWERHLTSQQPLALLLCDVDHFKLFNDHGGHQVGDHCLQTIAACLSASFRPQDIVARYGGEEFAVLLPNTREVAAFRAAQRARTAIEILAIPHPASPTSPTVTLSIGVAAAVCDGPISSPDELIAAADKHLYLAKQTGRNRVYGTDRARSAIDSNRNKE